MAVDPYALCPCGSGKKLKFCCSDLVGEIEKIHRMIEGEQPRAALRHVEQTLATSPGPLAPARGEIANPCKKRDLPRTGGVTGFAKGQRVMALAGAPSANAPEWEGKR